MYMYVCVVSLGHWFWAPNHIKEIARRDHFDAVFVFATWLFFDIIEFILLNPVFNRGCSWCRLTPRAISCRRCPDVETCRLRGSGKTLWRCATCKSKSPTTGRTWPGTWPPRARGWKMRRTPKRRTVKPPEWWWTCPGSSRATTAIVSPSTRPKSIVRSWRCAGRNRRSPRWGIMRDARWSCRWP